MNKRWMAGLLAGALAGALGPMLHAVAWHSGNDSGSSPLEVNGAVLSEQRAFAHWQGGYTLEIVVHSIVDARAEQNGQALSTGSVAEVVARGASCAGWPCEPGHTWRGAFTVPMDPGDGHVFIDPLATSAFLDAELVDEQTGEACRFGATWGTRVPRSTDASVAPSSETGRSVSVDAGLGARRTEVEARVHSLCWPIDPYMIEFGQGVGEITSRTTVVTGVDRAHVCVDGPTRRVCLDD